MAGQDSRRTAELKTLRAELETQLERLDVTDGLGPALAKMAQQVERTLRRLTG